MRPITWVLPIALLAAPVAAAAQGGDIVVRGARSEPSKWREAETEHVVVLSDGSDGEVAAIAHNLERLYFLLSVLLGRADKADDTVKLRVTLIGDAAEFQAMDLRNLRWQQGPFNRAFDISRYYDPREDGAVLATTRIDQKAVLERGVSVATALQGVQLPGLNGIGSEAGAGFGGGAGSLPGALIGLQSEPDLIPPINEQAVRVTADSMIYAGFAQHYLQTYFPAAYPRWYLDGFGQIFSTFTARGDDVVEYGRVPVGTSVVLRRFGSYPLADILDGRYLQQSSSRTRWTPVHAWMVSHFLFFSPTRGPQFRRYLQSIARGTPAAEAATIFGDPDALARELRAYYHAKKPFERMTYPADRAAAPTVRRLTKAQAAFVKGRLELGSRVETPLDPPAASDPDQAAKQAKARAAALAQRERWLAALRKDAATYAADPQAQLLLAEAECRSGNAEPCLAAADRALALAPGTAPATTWRGVALAQQAVAAPAAERAARLHDARATIGRANRIDTEAVLPLLAYYRSYVAAGEPVPDIAVDGLTKALMRVPDAPSTRLALGTALAARGIDDAARATLRPVAAGAYDSPERPAASAALAALARD